MSQEQGETETKSAGSRYLYEPFDLGPSHQIEVNQKVLDERWKALEYRLCQIEKTMERLEKRLWLTVFGVLAVVLSEAVSGFLLS